MLETGVDRLLKIVSEKGRYSAKDAAKRLSVSVDTIESWADVLEKENLMSKEYGPSGSLILLNTAKNTEEKEKKANELKEDLAFDVKDIEDNIREKEKAIKAEHKRIESYEKILLREFGESEKLEGELKALSIEGQKLKNAFRSISLRERTISKDTRSVRKIINSGASDIKKLERALQKFEDEKEKVLSDIKVLEKLSSAIKNVPANKLYQRIKDVERKTKNLRGANKKIGKKYSVITNLLDKLR